MTGRNVIDIELCTDCLILAANGDLPEDMTELPWPGIDEGWIVSPGHHHNLEDCGATVMAGTADCPYDEGSFSWSPCDVCRRPLGGDRYPATMFQDAWTPA